MPTKIIRTEKMETALRKYRDALENFRSNCLTVPYSTVEIAKIAIANLLLEQCASNCAERGCRRRFIRNRRTCKFCSVNCKSRSAMRAMRTREKGIRG